MRDIRVMFDKPSIYGMRRASVDGFMVVANSKDNVYRKCPLWKRGIADGAQMLPRADHRKPQARSDTSAGRFVADQTGTFQQNSKLGVGQYLTPVQTLKQHSAGTSFFTQVISEVHVPKVLKIPENAGLVIVDLFGYDGWAAEATFNNALGNLTVQACVTICHSLESAHYVHSIISRQIHTAARSGLLDIAGFPKFDQMVSALQAQNMPLDVKLNVSVLLPCGSLVVNDTLIAKWSGNEWTQEARACYCQLQQERQQIHLGKQHAFQKKMTPAQSDPQQPNKN